MLIVHLFVSYAHVILSVSVPPGTCNFIFIAVAHVV